MRCLCGALLQMLISGRPGILPDLGTISITIQRAFIIATEQSTNAMPMTITKLSS